MAPGFRNDVRQERGRNFSEANENRRIVLVMVGEEERPSVELHEHIALTDRRQLQHEHGVLVAEASEKPTIQKKGGQAIRSALRYARKALHERAGLGDAHAFQESFDFK